MRLKMTKLDKVIDIMAALELLDKTYTILLDSCIRVGDTGDHTLLVFNPSFVVSGDLHSTCIMDQQGIRNLDMPILKFIDGFREKSSTAQDDNGLLFNSGFVGYLSYDYGMEQLGIKRHNRASIHIPQVCFGYYEEFILIDWKNKRTWIKTMDDELIRKIEGLSDLMEHTQPDAGTALVSNFKREEFEERVQQVRQYIKRGDVYQVNISQQFRGTGSYDALGLYRRFREANYGPYNAYMNMKDFSILSTSPEQFIRVRGEQIMSRPIKGTIRKSKDPLENEQLKQELLESEKNRAELLMIIDLERNDLSRICAPGSVKVEKLYTVEEYATVNHLVSTITGTLLHGTSLKDIIKAMFPGGSITGAPKLRSMEIIEELENTSRGIYTGSIGYISDNGNMDFNIAIRTALIGAEEIIYNVGGGITWDSDPADEFEETIHKGKAIYQVLSGGVQG